MESNQAWNQTRLLPKSIVIRSRLIVVSDRTIVVIRNVVAGFVQCWAFVALSL